MKNFTILEGAWGGGGFAKRKLADEKEIGTSNLVPSSQTRKFGLKNIRL